jgi:hypothetical protein
VAIRAADLVDLPLGASDALGFEQAGFVADGCGTVLGSSQSRKTRRTQNQQNDGESSDHGYIS